VSSARTILDRLRPSDSTGRAKAVRNRSDRGRGARGTGRRRALPYAFVAPYVAFFLAVFAYPIGYAVYLSLHDYDFGQIQRPFTGLDNYRELMGDDVFWTALGNVGTYLLVNLPLTIAVAVGLAVLLDQAFRGRTFFRTVVFLPYVTSAVVVALLAKWIFANDGALNGGLGAVGAPRVPWLTSESWVMPTIAGIVAWKQLGFFVLLYLGGLQAIPRQLYEAARLDGANGWQLFRYITLPGLRPVTVLVTAFATIIGFQLFTEPYILTGGGPLNGSMTLVLYLYQQGFQSFEFGYAATIGIAIAVLVLVVVALQRRAFGDAGAAA